MREQNSVIVTYTSRLCRESLFLACPCSGILIIYIIHLPEGRHNPSEGMPDHQDDSSILLVQDLLDLRVRDDWGHFPGLQGGLGLPVLELSSSSCYARRKVGTDLLDLLTGQTGQVEQVLGPGGGGSLQGAGGHTASKG